MAQAEWIWLDEARYRQFQRAAYTAFCDGQNFCVACFSRAFTAPEGCDGVRLWVSADTRYRLYVDGSVKMCGPACVGGDWGRTRPLPQRYMDGLTLPARPGALMLACEVQLGPTALCDMSSGRGGFYLEGAFLRGGQEIETFGSDLSWSARLLRAYESDLSADFTRKSEAADVYADRTRPRPTPSPLAPLCQTRRLARPDGALGRIYAGYITCDIHASARSEILITPYETADLPDEPERIVTDWPIIYRGLRMRSVGALKARVVSGDATVRRLGLVEERYPIAERGSCVTGRADLDGMLAVCEHTLAICRQSIHLDSPRHLEPLGCTGDYWIESLADYFAFDEHRLTRFDLARTANLLRDTGGVMFHTAYSLMWVMMLRDYYMFTGDDTALLEMRDAVDILLNRFSGYENEDGLLTRAPNYMFVDWIDIDGHSMHHPPRALGQACLDALYYEALTAAAGLYENERYRRRAARLGRAFNAALWDGTRQMYISGLPGPAPVNQWMGENPDRPYFTLHANVMAVRCGLAQGDRARLLMRRVIKARDLPDFQPYFGHFVMDALICTGLFEQYGMPLLERYAQMAASCPGGLAEGWIKPCDEYVFDHSHAWGAGPRYQLPRALTGLTIDRPGMREITLRPNLMGLNRAFVRLITPLGALACELQKGKPPEIQAPAGMRVNVLGAP